jgi:hypothetical protein
MDPLPNPLCRALDAPEVDEVCKALRRHGALIVGPAALHIYTRSNGSAYPFRTLDFFVESKASCRFLGDILENHPEMEQHSTTDIAGHAASLAVPPLHVWTRGVTRTHTLTRRGKMMWNVYVLDCSPLHAVAQLELDLSTFAFDGDHIHAPAEARTNVAALRMTLRPSLNNSHHHLDDTARLFACINSFVDCGFRCPSLTYSEVQRRIANAVERGAARRTEKVSQELPLQPFPVEELQRWNAAFPFAPIIVADPDAPITRSSLLFPWPGTALSGGGADKSAPSSACPSLSCSPCSVGCADEGEEGGATYSVTRHSADGETTEWEMRLSDTMSSGDSLFNGKGKRLYGGQLANEIWTRMCSSSAPSDVGDMRTKPNRQIAREGTLEEGDVTEATQEGEATVRGEGQLPPKTAAPLSCIDGAEQGPEAGEGAASLDKSSRCCIS